ncbi:MAG TPA: cobalamin-binding protein [Gammaproteobacteria bacterium]|jgi:iron complex transport system substrate-binding protein|nr:cobalamin-binding protein [Gammaproteobacteria bacterium]
MVIRATVTALLLSLASLAHATITLTGADGKKLALSAPAMRVVSLAPDLTELVYAAGAGSVMVGAGTYSDYPAAAKRLPRIGDAFRVDTERLLALKPDLVLAWQGGTPVSVIARLRTLKLPVLVIGANAPEDIASNLELIGQATGHATEADAAARTFLAGLMELRNEYARRDPVRVFYEISAAPLYTIGNKQLISRMIGLCGGRNIFDDLESFAAPVSLEDVLARDPQAIVTGDDPDAATRLRQWQRWPQLSAVRTRNLFNISGDLLDRATPRILGGGRQLCKDLETTRQSLDSPIGN